MPAWCGECAKCAYVWLQFAAHLPADVVLKTFGDNFGERDANAHHFRELLGLTEHTPFECVGSAGLWRHEFFGDVEDISRVGDADADVGDPGVEHVGGVFGRVFETCGHGGDSVGR